MHIRVSHVTHKEIGCFRSPPMYQTSSTSFCQLTSHSSADTRCLAIYKTPQKLLSCRMMCDIRIVFPHWQPFQVGCQSLGEQRMSDGTRHPRLGIKICGQGTTNCNIFLSFLSFLALLFAASSSVPANVATSSAAFVLPTPGKQRTEKALLMLGDKY